MNDKPPLRPALWTETSVDETLAVYRDWAASYDADVGAHGYRTPPRIATVLAPPETLDLLLDALDAGGLLALSFNDPTLADGRHDARLLARLDDGSAVLVSREHGPHLDDMDMGADVIVVRRA